MADQVNFDTKSARRIVDAVRVVEGMAGAAGLNGTGGIRTLWALGQLTSFSAGNRQADAVEAKLTGGAFSALANGRQWTAGNLGQVTLLNIDSTVTLPDPDGDHTVTITPQVGDPLLILPVTDGAGGYSWLAINPLTLEGGGAPPTTLTPTTLPP